MISEERLKELDKILREDYEKKLSRRELTKIANDLVGYFSLLAEINSRKQSKNKDTIKEKNIPLI